MKNISCKKVLIVDDQINWRKALSRLLQKEGYEVSIVGEQSEAINIIAKYHFDLIILDVRLEDGDPANVEGLALLNYIQENNISTKTIVLTGYPKSLRIIPSSDAYLFKVPENSVFDSLKFKTVVNNLLDE
jgi:DNA-binding NtrC family response regulator